MERLKPKHIAFDFDNTLAYFEGGRESLFEIFTTLGIPPNVVLTAYEETKKSGGFNINKLIDRIEKNVGKPLDRESAKTVFTKWLGRSLKLYPDARDLLERLKKEGRTFSIISVGNRLFQEEKIALLGIQPGSIAILPRVGDKAMALQGLVLEAGGPIVYIDDKASELDAIRKSLDEKQVVTVRINRADSPYRNEKAQHEHINVDSLMDIKI